MTKAELQTILHYVHSGITVQVKVTGADGEYIVLPIDGIEAFSDETILLCRDSSIHFGEQKKEEKE